jgi:ubiquinone/menaquinone biosynthesis C-methylase UbiE
MSDWDAAQYHRLSDPQRGWGLRVLDRLQPRAGEHILDIGCGTGRLTSDITRRAAGVRVVGIDPSASMLRLASEHLQESVALVQADGTALPFGEAFDAVFSTAAFHWIPDHDRLFAEIHRVLRPGGRLVSQAGGGANLARLRERSNAVGRRPEFAPHFAGWKEPWRYAGVDDTRQRLTTAGFAGIDVSLESTPTRLENEDSYRNFVAVVCLRRQLDLVPEGRRDEFLTHIVQLAATDDPPFTLDYWRLNIDARKR